MVAGHRERDVPESPPRGVVALLIVAQRTVRILVVPEGQDGVGFERHGKIRGGHARLGSRTTDVSSRHDGRCSGRRRRDRRKRRGDAGLERLSTSGGDHSEKQDRAQASNHREGDDPRPTAFLHTTMMVDVGISTQAERDDEARAGVGMGSEGRTPQTKGLSETLLRRSVRSLRQLRVWEHGARSTRLAADGTKTQTPSAAPPIRSSGKWAATYIRTTGWVRVSHGQTPTACSRGGARRLVGYGSDSGSTRVGRAAPLRGAALHRILGSSSRDRGSRCRRC